MIPELWSRNYDPELWSVNDRYIYIFFFSANDCYLLGSAGDFLFASFRWGIVRQSRGECSAGVSARFATVSSLSTAQLIEVAVPCSGVPFKKELAAKKLRISWTWKWTIIWARDNKVQVDRFRGARFLEATWKNHSRYLSWRYQTCVRSKACEWEETHSSRRSIQHSTFKAGIAHIHVNGPNQSWPDKWPWFVFWPQPHTLDGWLEEMIAVNFRWFRSPKWKHRFLL
jgi:hypothetical protein